MLKTKKTMQTTNRIPSAIRVRHPVGTNHFQFRCHQFPRGGWVGNGGGCDCDSIQSFCPRKKPKSSNLLYSRFRLSRQEPEKPEIESEYARVAPRLNTNEEA